MKPISKTARSELLRPSLVRSSGSLQEMKWWCMLPRDRSITTSLKSTTNSPSLNGSQTPIQFVKGVGPKLGSVFQSREIETVKDLLYFFPRDYEDRSKIYHVSSLVEGVK